MSINLTGQNLKYVAGGNADQYTNQDLIWKIAKRFNDKSKELNGNVTSVRRRKVKSVEMVGVL